MLDSVALLNIVIYAAFGAGVLHLRASSEPRMRRKRSRAQFFPWHQ